MNTRSNLQLYLCAAAAALCLGGAWWMPGSAGCAVLGWAGVVLLVIPACQAASFYLPALLCGVLTNAAGFYWIVNTVAYFGGFGPLPTGAIFILFIAFSSLQFLIFALFCRFQPAWPGRWGLGTAAAWTAAEFITVRIFPWQVGHTQLAFLPLVQIADLAGSQLVTFLMFWTAESLWRLVRQRSLRFLTAPAVLALSLAYGAVRLRELPLREGRRQPVALVQANLTVEEKHNARFFRANLERYLQLSRQALQANRDLLLIWPETVITAWIPAAVGEAGRDPRLPNLGGGAALLTGTLSFESAERLFNSAMLILPDGKVPAPYHKRILMPFGEYMPLAAWFPRLNQLLPNAAAFTAGAAPVIFEIPPAGIKLAPLICYEDVVQNLARDAVRAGAALLVNLTNDAWFGDSAAPYQHHLIASFRAIENRRYLLRSTNSGLTAAVDPTGRTIAAIEPFSEGVLLTEVRALRGRTLYNRIGAAPWWILGLICTAWAAVGLRRSSPLPCSRELH